VELKHYYSYVDELHKYLLYLLDKGQDNTEHYKYLEKEFKLYTPL